MTNINSINSVSSFFSNLSLSKPIVDKLTGTTEKVHLYVIVGRILQGAAIALIVGGAFLLAVNVTYAAATVGIALVFATIGTFSVDVGEEKSIPGPLSSTPSALYVPGQPVGLINSGNNCWVNSIMQWMVHIPSLRDAVNNLPQEMQGVKDFVRDYGLDQFAHRNLGSANSQNIRSLLSTLSNTIRNDASQQDASEAMHLVLNRAPSHIRLFQNMETHLNGNVHNSRQCLLPINLANCQGKNFHQLLNSHFSNMTAVGEEKTYFTNLPNEMIMQFSRFSSNNGAMHKVGDNLPIPLSFMLPAEYVRSNQTAEYSIDAFIVHFGADLHGGHYISYNKTPDGRWWQCNDSVVHEITEEQVRFLLPQAYLCHYLKRP